MFEKFDNDNQEDIKILLGRAVNGLNEGFCILLRRYMPINPMGQGFRDLDGSTVSLSPTLSGLPTASTAIASEASIVKGSNLSPFVVLRWSFRDKKRMETILRDFTDINSRIHEKIKLCCLASSLGLDLRHLLRLRDDDNSKRLGFNIDAALKITSINSEKLAGDSLELKDVFWDGKLNL